MAQSKDVKEFEYPPKVTRLECLKGLWQTSKFEMVFHGLMTILLITGLAIDVLGIWLGGALSPIRQIFHGYIGVILVILYPIYLIKLIATKKTRMLMTVSNYIDIVLYAVLILTGIAIASRNQPWIDIMPWLPKSVDAPAIHTMTTYGWLMASILLPGGFLHGIASMYLMNILGGKTQTE